MKRIEQLNRDVILHHMEWYIFKVIIFFVDFLILIFFTAMYFTMISNAQILKQYTGIAKGFLTRIVRYVLSA